MLAIYPELARVMPMAERHRLRRRMDARTRDPFGSGEANGEHNGPRRKRDRAHEEEP